MVSILWDGLGTKKKASVGWDRRLEVLNPGSISLEEERRQGLLPLHLGRLFGGIRVIHGQLRKISWMKNLWLGSDLRF
jgi:hypothetical protein